MGTPQFLLPIKVNTKDNVSRKLLNNSLLADGKVNRIDVEDRINPVQRTNFPILYLSHDLVRDIAIKLSLHSKP